MGSWQWHCWEPSAIRLSAYGFGRAGRPPRSSRAFARCRVRRTNAIVVLYVLTSVLGGIIYTEYRIGVRTVVEQLGLWSAHGAFELKEHFAAVGLGLLPAYWYYWRSPLAPEYARTRAMLTATSTIRTRGRRTSASSRIPAAYRCAMPRSPRATRTA